MEYCSHIWSAAPDSCLSILDKIQARAIRLIDDAELTARLQALAHRRAVASLCLLYRYYYKDCSLELTGCIPPPVVLAANRTSRSVASSHPFALASIPSRTNACGRSFFPRIIKLWNSLPFSAFPEEFNLQSFKCNINRLTLH